MGAKKIELKPMDGEYWAYFAPDGYLQVRTIGESRADSRRFLVGRDESITWREYERAGYVLNRVRVEIYPRGEAAP